MGTEREHRERAHHNQEFIESIREHSFPDWIVTGAFYKSVHLVEALFHGTSRFHTSSHKTRNRRLREHHPRVWLSYHPLLNLSICSRYECEIEVTRRTAHEVVLGQLLPELEKSIEQEL